MDGVEPIQKNEFFGTVQELPALLANGPFYDECIRQLQLMGETYVAYAIREKAELPHPMGKFRAHG